MRLCLLPSAAPVERDYTSENTPVDPASTEQKVRLSPLLVIGSSIARMKLMELARSFAITLLSPSATASFRALVLATPVSRLGGEMRPGPSRSVLSEGLINFRSRTPGLTRTGRRMPTGSDGDPTSPSGNG